MTKRRWTPKRLSGREEVVRSAVGTVAGARPLALAAGLLVPALTGRCFEVRDLFAVGAGPVVLRPSLDFSTSYNDNIYSLPEQSILTEIGAINSREDLIFMLGPAINARLGRPDGDNRLDFDAKFSQYFYTENPDADSGSYSFSLSAVARGSKLGYDCRNSVAFANTILDAYNTVLDGIPVPSGNVERLNVGLVHNFTYALSPKTGLLAGGTFGLWDYTGDELTTRRYYNSQDWRANAGFGYSLTPKVSLDGKLHYGQLNQEPVSDRVARPPASDVFGGTVGVRGSFTPKLSGGVRGGYEQRWFSDDIGDHGYPLASVDLTQQFTDKTSATLAYYHGGGVSAYALSRSVTVSDSVSFTVQQMLGYRRPWFLTLGVRYALTEYVTSNIVQDQDNFQVSLGARYQIQEWFNLFANYSYQFGNRSTYDYAVNQVTLGFHLGY